MTKTIRILGMHCAHCESRVKNALEAISGIDSVCSSCADGTTVVTISSDVTDEELKATIEDLGFDVASIE